MSALTLQFTHAGLDALLSAQARGFKGQISHMAFGDAAYTPSQNQTELRNLKERVAIADSDYQDGESTSLKIAGKFDAPLEYAIREIGVYLDSGEVDASGEPELILLGVYSKANTTLGYRTPDVKVLQWLTLSLAQLPSESIEVKLGVDNLNLIVDKELAEITLTQLDTMHRQVKQIFRSQQQQSELDKLRRTLTNLAQNMPT
ncbi:phage tail protein [Pseudoalteromonas piscicida]|uniref:phage tail-collar fiber domain-containing protein n=1 Tax=Pseudoalteromonas piscicida TaxID=43662 RepID=UPI0030A60CF8